MNEDGKREHIEWAVESARKQMIEKSNEIVEAMTRTTRDVKRLVEAYERGEERFRGPMSATQLAEQIQHEILWLVPNLGLDTLTGIAAEADDARETAERKIAAFEARKEESRG